MIRTEPAPLLLRERAEADPSRAALLIGPRRLSYGEIADTAARVAGALAADGVGAGDRVAIMLPNGSEFLGAWLGANSLGGIEVPLSTATIGPRLQYVLDRSEPMVVVVHQEYLTRLQGVRLPEAVRRVVVVAASAATEEPMASWEEWLAAATPRSPLAGLRLGDPASIVFTSGTTGPSKGVLCSFGHMGAMADDTVEHFGLTRDDVVLDAHPLYHAHAQCQGVLAAVTADCGLVMPDRFSASDFLDQAREEGVTVAFLVGAAGLVMKQPPSPADRQHALRLICSIPVPPGRHLEMEERFGVPVIDEYGSTEQGIATVSPLAARMPGSCGRATPRREVRIVDEEGLPVPPGVKGEIVSQPTIPDAFFSEYFGMPAETVAVNKDYWFHSGDYGELDAEGNVFFLGRKKDAIRRLGENVSAVEVEQIIDTHPSVARSAVVGVPSELGEEEIWAVVQLLGDAAPVEPAALWSHCAARMERYAVPRYIELIEEFPLTSTGRVEKYRLRAVGPASDCFDARRPNATGEDPTAPSRG